MSQDPKEAVEPGHQGSLIKNSNVEATHYVSSHVGWQSAGPSDLPLSCMDGETVCGHHDSINKASVSEPLVGQKVENLVTDVSEFLSPYLSKAVNALEESEERSASSSSKIQSDDADDTACKHDISFESTNDKLKSQGKNVPNDVSDPVSFPSEEKTNDALDIPTQEDGPSSTTMLQKENNTCLQSILLNDSQATNDSSQLGQELIPISSSLNHSDVIQHSMSTEFKSHSNHGVISPNFVSKPLATVAEAEIITSKPSEHSKDHKKMGQIDTTAPIESVKHAVSKFGGIVDWKAHRLQTMERRTYIEQELAKAHEEIPLYKRRAEAAEDAKTQVLKDLASTKRLIEELKLDLERAQTEELQGKQDSELAQLRLEEMEQGIADEASVAAKAQMEVARARHTTTIEELKTVKDDFEKLRKDYLLLLDEKDMALKKADESVYASKQIEKTLEDLTIELITAKESLESGHAAHMEAEERRMGAALAKELDSLNWEKELKQAGEELERLTQQISSAKDLKSELDAASKLLQDLQDELEAYIKSKVKHGNCEGLLKDHLEERENKTHTNIQSVIAETRKEHEEIKIKVEKTTEEINCLKVATTSLKSELEREKLALNTIRQREGMASVAVASLEAELSNTESEIAVVQMREKETRQKMVRLPKQLQEAAQEADQAKLLAQMAREKLRKVREETEQAKAGAITIQSRLLAAQKEIEAARASEKLAVAAINALQESESGETTFNEDSSTMVTLSLDEYFKLSKQTHEAEERANTRVAAAFCQIEEAKESELRSLNKLEEVNKEVAARKEALKIAKSKAEKAKEGKLAVEQELRKWRAENERRRKAGETVPAAVNSYQSPSVSLEERKERKNSGRTREVANSFYHSSSPKMHHDRFSSTEAESSPDVKVVKKKKLFFPKLFLLLSKRKSHSSKMV